MSNDSNNGNLSMSSDDAQRPQTSHGMRLITSLSRRDFIKYSAGAAASAYLGAFVFGCTSSSGGKSILSYSIDPTVVKTTERVISFTMIAKPSGPNSGVGLYPTELPKIEEYGVYGYGDYSLEEGLPVISRYDIMPAGYANPSPVRLSQFANFFAMTDVHMTDKESPIQLIYLQQADAPYGSPATSIYSPTMLYTTQMLDACVQTINALHEQTPFDFGICLGDVANSSQYNELRWFIDIMDGKIIRPSSGAHIGAGTIDYQTQYKAAGLNPEIPWYQVLGNHDHFLIGSFSVDADPSLGLREAFTGSAIWSAGDVIKPQIAEIIAHPEIYPTMFDSTSSIEERTYYMGVIDGSTPLGKIIGAGETASINPAPTVEPDPDRRPLLKAQWVKEFFNSTSTPIGHGFNLSDPTLGEGFACYSFIPNPEIPLKVIVLDDTQSETDGSHDIHGHGFLDAVRWNWLKGELAAGQASNQLMIIAAHIPICVASVGSCMDWWESSHDPHATEQNAVSLTDLVTELQNTTNLLMWIAGHRHVNTVKAFLSPDTSKPELGFWQVETASLHDFPQQFRTFEVYLNSDYTVSVVAINVDPAVAEGTPAATSRSYAVAAQQIVQNNLTPNSRNVLTDLSFHIPVETMDPTRIQSDDPALNLDTSIVYGSTPGVPLYPSYNCELFKQLSPAMKSAMQALFPG